MENVWKFLVALTAVALMASNYMHIERENSLQDALKATLKVQSEQTRTIKDLTYIADIHTKTLEAIVSR